MKVLGARVIGVLALSAAAAFGATNACPTSNGAGLPSAGSATNVNNISAATFPKPSAPGGQGNCTAIDLTFSNFAVINVVNRAYVFQGGGAGNDPISSPLFLTYATERGTAGTPVDTDNNDGINNFSNKVTDPLVVGVGNITTASGGYTINQLKVSFGSVVIHGSANYELIACEGVAISGNFTAGNCTTAGGTPVTTTLDLSSATSLTLALAPTTILSLNNKVTLIGPGGAGSNISTSFLTLTNEFDQSLVQGVPEPATFAMLGSALLGVGFLRHRRRKT